MGSGRSRWWTSIMSSPRRSTPRPTSLPTAAVPEAAPAAERAVALVAGREAAPARDRARRSPPTTRRANSSPPTSPAPPHQSNINPTHPPLQAKHFPTPQPTHTLSHHLTLYLHTLQPVLPLL